MGVASERRRLPACCAGLLVAGAAVSAAGCAPSVIATTTHSVAGKVTVGPQCSGPQREGEGESCEVAYAGTEVRLLDGQGRVLARAQTNASGSFVLAGSAGRHTVRVLAPKVVRCPDQWVVLPQLVGDTPLRISCDSGRR